VQSLVGYSLQ